MPVDNLETKAMKAILNINDKVADINNTLSDLSMKLCHIIKSRRYCDSHRPESEYYN